MSEISVLFAVEAEQLLLAEMYEEAIELCNAGLNVYPEYASAYGIIARALQQLDRRAEAVEIIKNAIKQFPTNRLLKTVADDIENQPTAQAEIIPQSTENKSEFNLDDLVSSASDNNPLINNDEIFDIDSTSTDDEENSIQTSDEILQELKEEEQEFDWSAFTDSAQSSEIIVDDVDTSDLNIDDLFSTESEEITTEDVDSADLNIDDLFSTESEEITTEDVDSADLNIDDLFNAESEVEIVAYESDDDTSENEALLAQLYQDIEDEDSDIEIEGHVSNDEFLTNLTTKLEIVNSSLPKLTPEEEAMAQAQVYNFAESTYEDELGEIDDIIVPEVQAKSIEIVSDFVASRDEEESPIPEHLMEYVGMKGFASKLMYAEVMFDKKIKARNLSIIPGMDNSPIRDLRFVQKKTYSYQSLPNEPEFCVQSILPKDGQADFAGLFGFKSFQETNTHIIDSSVEEKANKSTTEVKKDIITETIANIYVLQGAYQEAIKAYSDLAEQYPDKREYFEKKISDTIAKEENNIIKE